MERLILPIPVSVNHWLGVRRGRVYPTPEAQQWTRDAIWLAKAWRQKVGWRPTIDRKVIVDYWIWWANARIQDPSNCEKVLLDALEGVLYNNDRWVLPRCQDFAIDRKHPRIELELHVKEE